MSTTQSLLLQLLYMSLTYPSCKLPRNSSRPVPPLISLGRPYKGTIVPFHLHSMPTFACIPSVHLSYYVILRYDDFLVHQIEDIHNTCPNMTCILGLHENRCHHNSFAGTNEIPVFGVMHCQSEVARCRICKDIILWLLLCQLLSGMGMLFLLSWELLDEKFCLFRFRCGRIRHLHLGLWWHLKMLVEARVEVMR